VERDGRVSRTVYPTGAPRVEDELTELGQTLREPIHAMGGWVCAKRDRIRAARAEFDQRMAGERSDQKLVRLG